ncbi:xylose isomerase [Terrimonas sp.]|uniref:metabolite traffic protein EboE n=1 Tax=Terrimonas sp. TaxID=1914338 RepID=UPI000D51FDC1|nr:metabolite traffic protein EboE [Terrimonas sp.]PVD54139.1 xylose isomerase [Terrimonas sp.]
MKTSYGHLTYCSNIHSGESWEDHFEKLKENLPAIKKALAPDQPFGVGLRLADAASKTLQQPNVLQAFKQWLKENDMYVFIINGFPYGSFHHTVVKDQVHTPDWLSNDRIAYTIRLAEILAELLPDGMEGGVSTPPLTYRHWHRKSEWDDVIKKATANLLTVADKLIGIRQKTGKTIHIDIEPEPDGLLDNGTEFLQWYVQYLLPLGIEHLQQTKGLNKHVAEEEIKTHIQLCYDICHFAVGYEDHAAMIKEFEQAGIKTGRIQVSAALKGQLNGSAAGKEKVIAAFENFNEPVYLHQVVARKKDGTFLRYPDMPDALADRDHPGVEEWRAHYHVPLFIEHYDILQSTQADIKTVLDIQKAKPFTPYLEVETYTWEVLPAAMRLPIDQSVSRELKWVKDILNNH